MKSKVTVKALIELKDQNYSNYTYDLFIGNFIMISPNNLVMVPNWSTWGSLLVEFWPHMLNNDWNVTSRLYCLCKSIFRDWKCYLYGEFMERVYTLACLLTWQVDSVVHLSMGLMPSRRERLPPQEFIFPARVCRPNSILQWHWPSPLLLSPKTLCLLVTLTSSFPYLLHAVEQSPQAGSSTRKIETTESVIPSQTLGKSTSTHLYVVCLYLTRYWFVLRSSLQNINYFCV